MDLIVLWIFFVWAFAFGTASAVVWRRRGGNAGSGFIIGFLFGIFGLAFCLLANTGAEQRERTLYRDCPYCRERVRRDATVCPHCHREVEPDVFSTWDVETRTVVGSTLGLPATLSNARVENSGEWWRGYPGQPWRRLPYVDRYGNAWDGTNWIAGKRPESERRMSDSPPEPVSR